MPPKSVSHSPKSPSPEPMEDEEERRELGEEEEEEVEEEDDPPEPVEEEEERGLSEEEEEEDDDDKMKEFSEPDSPSYASSPEESCFVVKPISLGKPHSKDLRSRIRKHPSKTKRDGARYSRSKKKTKINEEEGKKGKSASARPSSLPSGRFWSEEDEITVLQRLIDFKKEKGDFRPSDMVAFHESVKGKLFANISKVQQLYDKVRRLKRKFFANKEKIEDGKQPVFTKLHDSTVFDLSKRIWDTVEETKNEHPFRDDLKADAAGDFLSKYPNLSRSFSEQTSDTGMKSWLKDKWSSISSAKAEELEKKWQEIREEEANTYLKKISLIHEQTKFLMDSLKKK